MTEKVFTEDQLSQQMLIFHGLTATPILFAVLLLLLEIFESPADQNQTMNSLWFLPYLLAGVSLVEFALIQYYFLPKVQEAEDWGDAYAWGLICITMGEAIGIYGLLIGLIDIFASGQNVQWMIVSMFFISSALIMAYLDTKVIKPKLESFVGTSYTVSSSSNS